MKLGEGRPDALALLRRARGDVPTEAEQRSLVAALERAVAAGGGEGGGGADPDGYPSPPPPRRGWVRTAAGGAVMAVALGIVLGVRAGAGRSPPPAAAPNALAASAAAAAPSASEDATADSPVGPFASAAPETVAGAPPVPKVRPTGSSSHAARVVPSETALIESARAAVLRDPARALALTDAHRRDFPSGELAPEREVIAIDALARLGRRAEAQARADAFRAAHPRSIHTARIAAILDAAENRPPR